MSDKLTAREVARLGNPVKWPLVPQRVRTLADFFEITASVLPRKGTYWFRGHSDASWELLPSALRYRNLSKRKAAVQLLEDFRRIAEIKLDRPPATEEHLKWMQLAQHHGVPTLLLDWTESALFALYFATLPNNRGDSAADGMVYLFNPDNLRAPTGKPWLDEMNVDSVNEIVASHVGAGTKKTRKGFLVVPIKPVWNSARLMMQRGVFTFHGSRNYKLVPERVPSLVGIPILREAKDRLRRELDGIGIDEVTLFPELEYACKNLKRRSGLE